MGNLILNKKDVEILNSKKGLKNLFTNPEYDYQKALHLTKFDLEMRGLHEELIKLQNWVIDKKQKVIIIFEGRDAAGKGSAIRKISERINPRHYRVVALPKPTEEEQGQWYFQRFVNRLPGPGEIVFFDRSWYNRAMVEPVNGFCSKKEYKDFMSKVNEFEHMILDENTHLIKFYFSISKNEQARRFKKIKKDPLKKWQMSPVDKKAQKLWEAYTKYEKKMLAKTDNDFAPWTILDANTATHVQINATKHILKTIRYSSK